jgi:hypothetical protein
VAVVTPPFSLLLPVYHRDDPAHLERSLVSSTAEQLLPPDEVVLVQDGPVGPALRQAIERIVATCTVPVRLVELTAGLAACSHDVVARMDADDVSMPGRFAAELPVIADGADLVSTALLEFTDDEAHVLGRRTPPVGAEHIAAYARFHDPFNHPTVVYRRHAVQRAGGYEPVGLMEDYWLFARMIAAGAVCVNLPEPHLKYRVGAGAYARRGGAAQLVAEVRLQRRLHAIRFTSTPQAIRNVLVRGGYRLVPEELRKFAYRRLLHRGFADGAAG